MRSFLTTGFTWIDIDELNDALEASALPFNTCVWNVISYGGGGCTTGSLWREERMREQSE